MDRVMTTLRQWCRVCQRVTENAACPAGCARPVCAECLSHGVLGCGRAVRDE